MFAAENSKTGKFVPLLLDWFSRHARDLPWRRTRDPYAVWVSEIMLQQTQVKTVIPYWERWMRELPNLPAAAKASPDKIHKLWEGLGYYTRVRNLQKAARQIMEKHGGKFPQTFDDVLALPGIGRYTAGAICSIAFNQPTPILDGNVIRVLTRVFGIGENPREKKTNARLWQLAEDLVGRAVPSQPRRGADTPPYHSFLNQSLMELGALICTPRNPRCAICPVKKLCVAFCGDRLGELPNLKKGAAATARHFIAFVVERNGRFLVRQRPAGGVNAHLWEFPNVEIGARLSQPQHARLQNTAGKIPATDGTRMCCGSGDPRSAPITDIATHILDFTPKKLTPLCTVKHSITRYRITVEAFVVRLKKSPPKAEGSWKTPIQTQLLAFTSAHRKILGALKPESGR
jgi:A/G-specific adenine glycosylase